MENKKLIFISNSFLLLFALFLSMFSSNLQNENEELLLNEIMKIEEHSVNLAIIDNLYDNANFYFEIDNFTSYNQCNLDKFENTNTCKSLQSINIIQKSQNLTEKLEYFYFNNEFTNKINQKSNLIFWLDCVQYLLLIIALIMQSFALLFFKERDF